MKMKIAWIVAKEAAKISRMHLMIFRVWTQATVRADAWILMSRLVCLSVKGYGAVTLGIKLNSAEISPSKNYQ